MKIYDLCLMLAYLHWHPGDERYGGEIGLPDEGKGYPGSRLRTPGMPLWGLNRRDRKRALEKLIKGEVLVEYDDGCYCVTRKGEEWLFFRDERLIEWLSWYKHLRTGKVWRSRYFSWAEPVSFVGFLVCEYALATNKVLSFIYDSADMFCTLLKHQDLFSKVDFAGSIFEIHNTLSMVYRLIKKENGPIQYNSDVYILEFGDCLGYVFKLPRDTHTLIDIANILDICVDAYSSRVLSGYSIIVAVVSEQGYRACLEIRLYNLKNDAGSDIKYGIFQAKTFNNRLSSGRLCEAIAKWVDINKIELCTHDFRYHFPDGYGDTLITGNFIA